MNLTKPQQRALGSLQEEGGDGYYRSRLAFGSYNWYHPNHRPGNWYVDYRTASVLIRQGLAVVKYGVLYRTEAGTELARSKRAERSMS